MAISKPRTRLVYFRISEEEFHQILHVCEQTGARSISDLARLAIQRFIASEGKSDDELARTRQALNHVLEELKTSVQQLTNLTSTPAAAKVTDKAATAEGAGGQSA